MKKFLVPILTIIFAGTGFAQVKSTVVHSAVTFQIKNVGITTSGSFGAVQAAVQFTPANLATSTIEASLDASSINTDNDSRDEHLKSEDFFDVTRYPKISLKSVSFKHKSGNNYSGQFNLTLKNKTKLVEFPFSYVDNGSTATLKGSFKLNRLDYGVGTDSFTLSNDVTVTIEAEIRDYSVIKIRY